MLPEKDFKTKYETTYLQRREESYLEEVPEGERELYEDVEILTGFTFKGRVNKFFQLGQNKGKVYNTVNKRLENSFKRFLDKKMNDEEEFCVWEKIWDEAVGGDKDFVKILLERGWGKIKDEVEIKTEGEITFTTDPRKIFDTNEEDED